MGYMLGKILSVVLRLVGVVLFLSGVYDFFVWFRNTDLTMNHIRIDAVLWVLIGILVFVLGHSIGKVKSSQRVITRRVLLVIGVIVLVFIG